MSEETYIVEHDEFGEGTLVNITEDQAEFEFEHGIEAFALEDVFSEEELDEIFEEIDENLSEDEQLVELSKALKVRYIKKASDDIHNAGFKSGEAYTKKNYNDVADNTLKSIKRKDGITLAAKKLAKESTDLVELALNKQPLDFAKQLDAALKSRIVERLEVLKVEMAQGLYGTEDEDAITEEELAHISETITEEEFEQLDELSQNTLQNYRKKA